MKMLKVSEEIHARLKLIALRRKKTLFVLTAELLVKGLGK